MRTILASLLILPALVACGGVVEDDGCAVACTGDTVCVDTQCVPLFPRSYRLVLQVSLASEDPDGSCWDEPFCGDPDPRATLSLDGREVGRTDEASDTRSFRWVDQPFTVTLDTTTEVTLEVVDVDVDVNDAAARCVVKPVTASMVRGGRISCFPSAGESSIEATIEPAS